ncbi:hypothetical protein BBJ28_00005872 [Nothophytophthora sp. Chile5]|nr:hypothetical protein BBJ28_00005872 [Nothophytophthora sp. Chile5]
MAAWIPWSILLSFLPVAATDLLKDTAERQRMYEDMQQAAQDYSKWLLLWAIRAAQVRNSVMSGSMSDAVVLGRCVFTGISFLFVTATVLYAMLYYLVVPSRFHEQEIFFNYGHRHAAVMQPDQAVFVPTASLNLLDSIHQWDSAATGFEPATQPVLLPGVKYDVIVDLTVPESRMNAEVGVFMVTTTLRSPKGKYRASSARPVTLHDLPAPVRWLRLGAWLVPYALGFSEPAQSLRVLAINGYEERKEHPLTQVDIELNTPKLQVYSAKLTIIAQLTGVRYLMYHWSVPTAILVILNIVFIEALALVILYAFYAIPQTEEEATDAAMFDAAAAARQKAKLLFETQLPTSAASTTPSIHTKSEVIDEVSATTTAKEETVASMSFVTADDDGMPRVKQEPVVVASSTSVVDSP